MEEKKHAITIKLEPELHEYFKAYCAARYTNMTAYIKQHIVMLKEQESRKGW